MTVVAIGLAMAAAAMVTQGAGSTRRELGRALPLARACAGGVVVVLVAGLAVAPGRVGIACVGAGDVLAVVWIVRQGRRRRIAAVEARAVVAACEALAAELVVGQPPGVALQRVADGWPPLQPVAEAARLGADVPSALRGIAVKPGLVRLGSLAAAWQVSERSGSGLATSLRRTAEVLRADQRLADLVAVELASARSSARMLAALPFVALVLGASAGVDVEGFFATPFGLGVLASGSGLLVLGMVWLERLARIPGS